MLKEARQSTAGTVCLVFRLFPWSSPPCGGLASFRPLPPRSQRSRSCTAGHSPAITPEQDCVGTSRCDLGARQVSGQRREVALAEVVGGSAAGHGPVIAPQETIPVRTWV